MREEYSDSKILQASKATGLTPKTIIGILEQADRGGASLRARSVLNHLLLNGSCTTSDLAEAGYNHPPRAVRDLKDAGVIVVTKMEKYQNPVSGKPSRRARYSIVGYEQSHGRRPLTRVFSDSVKQRGTCEACGSATNLQADHRVPFAIAGESFPHVPSEFMALCGSCNREKSWTCETKCPNWTARDPAVCRSCYWSNPAQYSHVAMEKKLVINSVISQPDLVQRASKVEINVEEMLRVYLDAKGE